MKITKPVMLLDLGKCENNIGKMVEKAKEKNVTFRPHFKTHQSIQLGEIFKRFGIDKITVSSVEMAQYFANAGWNDITIAFPFNILEINSIKDLSDKINLNILISSQESALKLIEVTSKPLNYFVEIDTGYHRSGISAKDIKQVRKTVQILSQHNFKGFLTHSGNTYKSDSTQKILDIHHDALEKMKKLKIEFIKQYPDLISSTGDTPSCTLAEEFDDIDEIRPGNFIFFDLMQHHLGVCNLSEIAVCVACPVVDINRERNQIVIYGGGIHLSKEFILQNGNKIFGQVVKLSESVWKFPTENSYLNSLSQEHGIIQASENLINEVSIGDILGIIPVHSCMTANLMGSYRTLNNQIFYHFSNNKRN